MNSKSRIGDGCGLALGHYRDALDLAALSPPAFDMRAVRERVAALQRLAEARP